MRTTMTLDVNAARLIHIDWLMQLESSLDLGPNPAGTPVMGTPPQSDTECALGVWLHGPGRLRYGQLDEIKRLTIEHRTFHRTIDKAAARVHQGEREKALALFQDARRISKDIVYLLTFIELEILERERKRHLSRNPFNAIRSFFSGIAAR
ncbi:Chemoreceptor zinc-binding domain-containing protein conserved in MTBa [uncultured Gammaproteobacteria bacterium]